MSHSWMAHMFTSPTAIYPDTNEDSLQHIPSVHQFAAGENESCPKQECSVHRC